MCLASNLPHFEALVDCMKRIMAILGVQEETKNPAHEKDL
jgi:hypothetical protein